MSELYLKKNHLIVVIGLSLLLALSACEASSPTADTAAATATNLAVPAPPTPPIVPPTATVDSPGLPPAEEAPSNPPSVDLSAWNTLAPESDLFTIVYPADWEVMEPVMIDPSPSAIVWEFRGEPMSRELVQNVALGRYNTPRIAEEMSLDTWLELVDNSEFEFERLRADLVEINGRDAYAIHDRVAPPARDVYVTYIRCQNRVWFLQTLDVDLASTELEAIYEQMLESLSLNCDE